MFRLRLLDRNGIELKLGDTVRISDGRYWTFYSEIKYLGNGEITPFSTFSYHSIEKVDKLPEGLVESTETRYKIWIDPNYNHEDRGSNNFETYLADWRFVEEWLRKRYFIIEPEKNFPKTLFDQSE